MWVLYTGHRRSYQGTDRQERQQPDSGTGIAPSWHATEVAKNLYGNTLSIAKGVSSISSWNVNPWITGVYLRVGPEIGVASTKAFTAQLAGLFLLTLALVTAGVLAMQRLLHAPLGYGLRAARDSVLRARAIGAQDSC